ncbi:hypothetical protein AQPW35_21600 [Rubrivivax pictus]|uniref:Uncharacterized protein n=1 Tax=Pseudaquabacterium pictum TaxID=2315236 RepID=A0A480AN39_9BURK|nr:hypothetical protein AQPW35_21600 [Rubrivivax pictus]
MQATAAATTPSTRRQWPARALAALCLATLGVAAPALAAPPALPASAATPAGFVPAGWQVAQQVDIDLNRDKRTDAVLLLQPEAPPAPPGTGQSPERLLAVLLHQRDGWVLAAQNARLVPRVDLATQEDPLVNGELAAGRGGFSLSLGLTSTAGSYLSAVQTYRFRLERGCVRLIGHDTLQTHRGTQDTQDTSINFLTGAVVVRSGNAQTDATTQRRSRLSANPRRCLPDLDGADRFQPLGAPR